MFNDTQTLLGIPQALAKTAPMEQAGAVLHKTKNCLKVIFAPALYGSAGIPLGSGTLTSTSVAGGGQAAVGSYLCIDDLGNPAVIPNGAIITNTYAIGSETPILLPAVCTGAPVNGTSGNSVATGPTSGIYTPGALVGTSATVAFKLLNAGDLLGATAITSLTPTSTPVAGTPVGTVATMLQAGTAGTTQDPYSSALGTQVQATVATATLTAGAVVLFIEYVIQ